MELDERNLNRIMKQTPRRPLNFLNSSTSDQEARNFKSNYMGGSQKLSRNQIYKSPEV